MRTYFLIFLISIIYSSSFAQEDWQSVDIKTGETPKCYYCRSKTDMTIDNFLRIYIGGNADIAVKLVDVYSDECIRYVFIKAGDIYEIRNIPQGAYYVKIAYGNDWRVQKVGPGCEAKFYEQGGFQKGEDIMDYYLKESEYGYQVPSYEIKLEFRHKDKKHKFNTSQISEEEFNK